MQVALHCLNQPVLRGGAHHLTNLLVRPNDYAPSRFAFGVWLGRYLKGAVLFLFFVIGQVDQGDFTGYRSQQLNTFNIALSVSQRL